MLPSTPKVNAHGLSAMNESSGASISLTEWESCDDHVTGHELDSTDGSGSGGAGEEESDDRKGVILCDKTDGNNWQCKREAKYGNSLCDHHLALAIKNSINQSSDEKKKYVVLVETECMKRRVRTKKTSAAANPHEIYYYSGFRPRWG